MRYLLWSKVDRAWVRLPHPEERSEPEWEPTDDITRAKVFYPIDLLLQLSISHNPDDLLPIPYPEDVRNELDRHILECQELLREAARILGSEAPEDGYDTEDHTRILTALRSLAASRKVSP